MKKKIMLLFLVGSMGDLTSINSFAEGTGREVSSGDMLKQCCEGNCNPDQVTKLKIELKEREKEIYASSYKQLPKKIIKKALQLWQE